MVSLNRLRKFRRLFDHTLRCKETPRLDAAPWTPPGDHLRSIRRRAAEAEDPFAAAAHARMERIARIRNAIAEGRYHVSPEDLSEKLINHMLTNHPPKL